jgi:hypothetical protein
MIPLAMLLMNVFFVMNLQASPADLKTQDDTVYVQHTDVLPVFDGIGNDDCWAGSDWQEIDQVWIPWGTEMDSVDLYGRYKVIWSSNENVLIFLLEINDDVISDAYVPGVTAAIYNFDMFEVFIDEDKSGGYHVFDGYANNEASLGLNAENAFAYHIFTAFPESGSTNEEFRAEDIAGTSWGDYVTCNYVDHFPEFILRKEGNVSTWEFSIIVYDDTYSPENIEGSRVTLTANKIIGLSLAINDDDEPEIDPTVTERDNFVGSVAVTQAAYNDHWKNADDFGTLKLISEEPISTLQDCSGNDLDRLTLYPNPASDNVSVEFSSTYTGEFTMMILDRLGREIFNQRRNKTKELYCENIDFQVPKGMYFLQLRFGENIAVNRINFIR